MDFDVFIPCAPKDENKLPYVIDSIRQNVSYGSGTIHVSSPSGTVLPCPGVAFYKDEDVLPFGRSGWACEQAWNYQQCLKLFQEVTSYLYLVVDCDTIFNRPVEFFENGKMVWHTSKRKFNKPYFDFQMQMIGIGNVLGKSAIANMGFYDRNLVRAMLADNGYATKDDFIRKAQSLTSRACYMCEQNLYASYCHAKHPGHYIFRNIVSPADIGKAQRDPGKIMWTKEEIENNIKSMKKKNYAAFSLHSWFQDV